MLFAKYRTADGQFLCVWPNRPDYNSSTEAVQEYPEHLRPDPRLHRFDATVPDKKRMATPQELAVFDEARADEAALAELEGVDRKMLKAAVIWMAQRLGVPLATARAEILAIRKGL